MTSYWVNFAASGNPNGGSLVKWPAYIAKDDQVFGIRRPDCREI
jgi:carboxylesterase type B